MTLGRRSLFRPKLFERAWETPQLSRRQFIEHGTLSQVEDIYTFSVLETLPVELVDFGMADTLPSPPESPSSSSSEQEIAPSDPQSGRWAKQLDELLEQYLILLDRYTVLREDLSKSFASGFFSLAQAQRGSTLGPGRRYGEECYDERMKALRRIRWKTETDKSSTRCEIQKIHQDATEASKSGLVSEASSDSHKSPQGTVTVEDSGSQEKKPVSDSQAERKNSVGKRKKQNPEHRDPLTWFGILVPPALRQTQAHFTKTVESQIPELLRTQSQMEEVEQEIWMLRQQLGVITKYESTKSAIYVHEKDTSDTTESQPSSKKERKALRQGLASRPAHSKTHLLKLGD